MQDKKYNKLTGFQGFHLRSIISIIILNILLVMMLIVSTTEAATTYGSGTATSATGNIPTVFKVGECYNFTLKVTNKVGNYSRWPRKVNVKLKAKMKILIGQFKMLIGQFKMLIGQFKMLIGQIERLTAP